MYIITATRFHDISCGHRVVNHESKCAHLHGHNYRIHFTVLAENPSAPLDTLGRVIDFDVIKIKLCEWLERVWDHRFLVFTEDPLKTVLVQTDPAGVVVVHFNPTAENMAAHLLNIVGPEQLKDTGVRLIEVTVEETRKCNATARL